MVAACVAYARHWIARGADAVARRRRLYYLVSGEAE